MTLHRQAAKRDTAEGPILDALRAVGAICYQISGAGLPDILVHYRGCWTPLEVKAGKGKLTEAQAKAWMQAPFAIVRTVDDAFKQIGIRVKT